MEIKNKKNILYLHIFLFILLINLVSSAADCFPEYVCGEWEGCGEDGIQKRTCTDNKCGNEKVIERRFCGVSDCEPNIKCSDWEGCNYESKTNDIINERLSFTGYQQRNCIDFNECISDFSEEMFCNFSFPVKVNKVKWCNEEYVEIFDVNTDKLVSRIKETKIGGLNGLNKIDISFLTEEFGDNCNYCFDGIKDYDETGVDCGGSSCGKCVQKIEFFDWAYFLIFISWGIFFLMLIVFFSGKRRSVNGEINAGEDYNKNIIMKVMDSAKMGTDDERILEENFLNWFKGLFK